MYFNTHTQHTYKMPGCSYCQSLTNGHIVTHSRIECPRRRLTYCSICCAYGHTVSCCPDKIALAVRTGKSIKGIVNLEIKLQDDEKTIREFLKTHGVEPTKRQAENEKLLRDLANAMEPPHLLVFLPCPN
jgi:hypothetical protein